MTTVTMRYFVDDVDATIGFYTKQLGFAIDKSVPEFASLSRGDLRLLLNSVSSSGWAAETASDGRRPLPQRDRDRLRRQADRDRRSSRQPGGAVPATTALRLTDRRTSEMAASPFELLASDCHSEARKNPLTCEDAARRGLRLEGQGCSLLRMTSSTWRVRGGRRGQGRMEEREHAEWSASTRDRIQRSRTCDRILLSPP